MKIQSFLHSVKRILHKIKKSEGTFLKSPRTYLFKILRNRLQVLDDGQVLRAVNDLFVGRQTHASARYEISQGSARENQSSSGVIVSTGLGATGWLKSILAGASGIARVFGVPDPIGPAHSFDRSAPELYYTVREPYPSASTGADMVFGRITARSPLQIVSSMPENGVIFSDGMEQDFLQFNSGSVVTIGIADQRGYLVV